MAGNYSQQYAFNIKADTTQAQSQLDKLQRSLTALQSKQYTVVVNDNELRQAATAAQTLQQQLIAATNVKTGQLDLSKFNASLAQAGTNVSELGAQLLQAGESGRQAFTDLTTTIANTTAPVKTLSKALTNLGTTLINTIKWQAASSLVHGMMSEFNHAISYAKELNSTLNDIRIVTGASANEMVEFANKANSAAKSLSTTTGEFAKASLIYYQQGDNAAEVAQKAAITTKAANIAFTASAQEMSQMLTAVWNSYRMGGDELEHAVDVMAKLGATTATSMEEISTGMQKVAATANVVGVNMEQMSAMIATSSSVTRQSAEIVGTSWNTILSRFTSLKLGETLEDGVDLTKYTKALESIGVQALDVSGNLREAGTLIDDIGEKWQLMNEAQKAAFAQTVGGVRQYTQIMAFFENFDKYQANLKTAQSADGELNKQQEIYAQSWEAASKRAKAAMEDLYSSLINDKAMITFSNFFTNILNLVNNINEGFGGALNVIGLIVGQLVSANLEKVSTAISETITNIKTLFSDGGVSQYQSALAGIREELDQLADNAALTESQQLSIRYDAQILEMKEKLAGAQDRLTANQKAAAEAHIQQMQALKSLYADTVKLMEQAQEKERQSIENAKEDIAIRKARENNQNASASEIMNIYKNEAKGASLEEVLASHYENGKFIDIDALKQAGVNVAEFTNEMHKRIKEASDSLDDLAVKFSVLQNASEHLTLDQLVDLLVAVKQDALNSSAALEQLYQKFHDGQAISFEGEDGFEGAKRAVEEYIDTLEKMNNQDASNFAKTLKIDMDDVDNFDKLQEVIQKLIDKFRDLEESANKGVDEVRKAGRRINEDTNLENVEKNIQKGAKSFDRMRQASAEAEQALKDKFNNAINATTTKIQNFVSAAIAIQRVTTAFSSLNNAVKSLSNPDISAWQKFTNIISAFVSVGYAAVAIAKLVKIESLKTAASKILEAAGWTAAKVAIDKYTESATGAMVVSGGFILLLSAIAFGVVALISHLSKLETAEEKWQKKQEELNNSIDKTKEKHEELGQSLGNLSSVMNDTTLTYEDQLAKINEIVSAYGLQASAIDVLTGKYGGLLTQVQEVAQAQAKSNYEEASRIAEEARTQVETNFNNRKMALYQNPSDWSGNTQDSLFKMFDEIFQKNAEFFNSDTQEAQIWTNEDFLKKLNDIGFNLQTTGAFKGFRTNESYNQNSEFELYKLLTSYEGLTNLDNNTVTGSIRNALGDQGYSTLFVAEDLKHQTELVKELFEDGFDIARIDKGKASIQEIQEIINNIGTVVDNKDRTTLVDYIGQFDQYKETAIQLKAIQQLATNISNIKGKQQAPIEDQNALQKKIEDDLINSGVSVDVVLQLNPVDIKYDENQDKYIIDEAAEHYAQAIVKAQEAANKLVQLRDSKISKAGQNTTISSDDYLTLQQSEIFDSDEDLRTFVLKSAGERKAIWADMIDSATNDQIQAIQDEVNFAEQRLQGFQKEQTNWLNSLDNETQQQIEDNKNERVELRKELVALNSSIAEYEQLSDDQKQNYTGTSIDNLKASKTAIEERIDQLNEALATADMYENEIVSVTQQLRTAQEQLDAANYWENTGSKIEKATNNAEKFAAAIGQKGKMSEDDLAWLTIMTDEGEKVLQQYAQSSDQWNEYVYNKAKKYYAELYSLREGDVVAQMTIKQKMEELDTNYYKTLEDKAKNTAENIKKEQDKQLSAQEDVLKTISSNLTKMGQLDFQNLTDLRQSLIDAGIAAERVEEIINKISGAKTDKDQIKAGMVAATEAALAKLGTLGAREADYQGVVVSLDTSKVDYQELPVTAVVPEDHKPKTDLVLDTKEAETKIDTLNNEVEQNHPYVIVASEDGTINQKITNWRTELNDESQNVLKFTVQNGDETQTVEAQIRSWIPKGETVQITVEDGTEEGQTISTTIDSWIVGEDGNGQRYVQVALDDGNSTLKQDITDITAVGQKIQVTLSDGTVKDLPADIGALVNPETGFETKLIAGGNLQEQIDAMNLTATVTLQMDAAKKVVQEYFNDIDLTYALFEGSVDVDKATQLLSMPFENLMKTLSIETGWTEGFIFKTAQAGVKWDATQARVIKEMVEKVAILPKSEFDKIGKENIQALIASLATAMQSNDSATAELASQLWAGLSVGMRDNYNAETWSQILEACGLTGDMLQAFKDALGIASPSKLTKELAYWLFAGLEVGTAEEAEKFHLDLTAMTNNLTEDFTDAMANVGLGKIIIGSMQSELLNAENELKYTDKFGFSEDVAKALFTAKGKDLKTKLANGAENYADIKVEEYNNTKKYFREKPIEFQKTPEEEVKQIKEQAYDEYYEEIRKALNDGTYTKNYIKSKQWNETNLSATQKDIINAAYQQALDKMNVSSIDELNGEEQLDQFLSYLDNFLNKSEEEVQKSISNTWNEIETIWQNGLNAIYAQEQEKAKETYQIWKDTFKAIADARAGLMEGKTVMEALYGKPEELSKIVAQLLEQGYSLQEAMSKIKEPDFVPQFEAPDIESYRNMGNQKYLNFDEKTQTFLDTNLQDFEANVRADMQKLIESQDRGDLIKTLKDTIGDPSKLEKGTAEQQGLLRELKEKGLVTQDNKYNDDLLNSAAIKELEDAMVKGVMAGMDESKLYALLAEAQVTIATDRYGTSVEARSEAEQQIGIWRGYEDIIHQAIEAIVSEGNLESMNVADQNELVTAMQKAGFLQPDQGIEAISLDNLQTASDELAESIQTLATEILQAMKMLQEGEADSFAIGDDGHVTVTSHDSWANMEQNGWANNDMSNVELDTLKQQMMQQAQEQALEDIKSQGYRESALNNEFARGHEAAQEAYNAAYEVAMKQIKQDTQVRVTTKLGDGTVSKEEAGTTITEAQGEKIAEATRKIQDFAKGCGVADKDFQALLFSLGKGIKSMSDFSNLSKTEQEQLLKLATNVSKASKGWEGLQKAQKESFNILKKGQKDTYEYFETLNSVTENVKAIFGGAKVITKEFVEAHLADIEKMANGDMEAAERVEAAVLEVQSKLDGWEFDKKIEIDIDEDGVIDQITTIGQILNDFGDEFNNKEIGFELTANQEPAINSLNDLLAAGELTATNITRALELIGWEPEIKWEKVTMPYSQIIKMYGHIYDSEGNIVEVEENVQDDEMMETYIPVIQSAKKTGTGVRSMPSTQRPRERATRTPRSTRQPREREERPREVREDDAASRESEAKRNEDIERYHQVNKQLEHQSLMLERVNKLKTAKYGGDYLKALRQENEELRRQAKIQEEKFKQAQEYLAFDRKRLESLQNDTLTWWTEDGQTERSTTIASLGLGDLTPMFDEEGNLDYQDLMEKLNARYNEMREKYMSDPETYGQLWDEFQSWYDKVSEYISQYEESLANTQQYINQMLDQINQLSSNNAEIIKYKVQLEIEEINFDKSWQDYLQKAWSGELEHVADILSSKFKQIIGSGGFITDENGQQRASGGVLGAIDTYMSQMKEAQAKYDVYTQYKTQIDEFAKNGSNIDDIKALIGQDFINEADYAEIIKSVRTNLLTELNNLEEYRNALATAYENAITLAQQEWNKYQQIIDHNTSLIDTFKELAQLTGEAQKDADRYRAWSKEMNTAQLDAYDDMIKQSAAMYQAHKTQLDALMEKANGDLSKLTDEEREQYEKSLAAMQSAEDQKLAYVKKKLELLRAEYEETVDDILRKLQDAMLSTTGSLSFEDLANDYDWYNEQQERYLSSAQELYEVSKLNRNINDAIANTTNKASKERLQALQNTINKQSELNKLTDYDVQQMGLQYELAIALDELENARNNKSIVRLTRDEYGNMGYQYTADEDQTSAAQQKYEDILQKINDTAAARVKDLEQAYIQTMNDYYTQARQIALEYADDEETRNAKLQELAERTKNRLQFLSEQMNIANANLMESNAAIFEHYQDDVERYVGTPDSSEGINPIIADLSSKWQEHQELIDQNVKDIIDALHTYLKAAQETADETGTSMSAMSDKVTEAGQQNEYAAVSMSKVTTALSEQYGELNEATESWKAYAEAIEAAKEAALQMLDDIATELDNLGIDDASSIWGALGYGGTGSGTGSSTQSSGPAGGGGAGKVDTVKYSIKDLTGDDEDGITGVPVKGDYKKNSDTVKTLNAGGTYTFSKMRGSYVWSDDAGGWINIQYLDKEQSKISDYSTTGLLLSDAIAQYRVSNGFKTGGLVDYTGPAWVDGTPSAPEYVLNSRQTDQMFNAIDAVSNLDVELIKDIFGTIGMMATTVFTNLNGMLPSDFNTQSSTDNSKNVEQHIEIHAEFPDASDYAEIKEAFDSLANTATQYAFR